MAFIGNLYKYQKPAKELFLKRGNLLVAYEMGLGKLSQISEPVLTPWGWTTMGSVSVGDFVIGKDGKPTKVIGVFPQGIKDNYKVTMNDESYTFVGLEHLWSVQHNNDTVRRPDTWQTLSTKDLLDKGLVSGAGNLLWKIPMVDPVQFSPDKELPISPYVLGAWLGDGSTNSGGFTSDDAFMIEEIRREGYVVTARPHHQSFYIKGVISTLRDLGVLENKYIPACMLRASVEDRLSLLQGLLDTDGTVQKNSGAEFCSSNPSLVEQVIELVQSLGGIARPSKPRITYYTHNGEKKAGKPSYRVSVKLPQEMIPFRLPRKLDKYSAPSKYPVARRIKSIEYSHAEESVCIKVANKDGLYVTRHFIVTHNTPIAIACAEELIDQELISKILIVCPANLRFQWAKSIVKFTELDISDVLVLEGTPKKREQIYKDYESDYIIMSYENVVNDWKYVRKIKPDLIILDEATAIKSFRAKRSKKIKQLKAEFRIGLTGTPIDNGKPEEIFSIMEWVDRSVLGRFDLFDKAYIVRNNFGGIERYKNLDILHSRLLPAVVRKCRLDKDVREYLPRVDHDIWHVNLHRDSQKLYGRIANDILEEFRNGASEIRGFDIEAYYNGSGESGFVSESVGRIMAMHTGLEQLLDHPDLLVYSAQEFADKTTTKGSKYAYELWQKDLLDDVLESYKLDLLVEKVSEICAFKENKVIIFTRFVDMVEIIAESIPNECVTYTGSMSAKQKTKAVETFTTSPDCRVFVSSHAGDRGLDLFMANHLINYDHCWSPGKADQLNGRHVRASSKFDKVFIHDFCTKDTIEERKLEMLEMKRQVALAVFDGKGTGEVLMSDLQTLKKSLEEWFGINAQTNS